MATKQALAERIAQLTRDEQGDHLGAERQAEFVAELVKANKRDQLTDRLKALTDPIAVPPAPTDEPGTSLQTTVAAQVAMLDRDRLELLRRTIANDLTDDEFAIFAARCNQSMLDPFANQIHAIIRKSSNGERRLCIQTGIDGFRVIADRTGCYAGSDDPIYEGEVAFGSGKNAGVAPMRATVTVRKIVQGQVFEVTRHAYWAEFYPGDGSDGFMYRRMPHVMLAKCAEAQAHRAAFPADLSGIYVDEEMMQADALEVASTVRSESTTHDAATEVRRWVLGFHDALEAAEPEKTAELAARWKKIEPAIPKLDEITTMRDMRRACAVAKSVLKVEIHPVDVLPDEPTTGEQHGPPPVVVDRDPREDTIDVTSTEHYAEPGIPVDVTEDTGGVHVAEHEQVPAALSAEVCAAGDGGFTADEHPIYSEDGKPYHARCAPML